jgi:hypothetical protein
MGDGNLVEQHHIVGQRRPCQQQVNLVGQPPEQKREPVVFDALGPRCGRGKALMDRR